MPGQPDDATGAASTALPAPRASAGSPLDPIASPPPGRGRRIASAAIALWLVGQLALPISYYAGESLADERFAWRMFSSVSVFGGQCALSVVETVEAPGSAAGRTVREPALAQVLHPGWVVHMRRGRQSVIDRFLSWRCRHDPSIVDVEVRRSCDRGPEAGVRLEARRACRPAAAGAADAPTATPDPAAPPAPGAPAPATPDPAAPSTPGGSG